MSPHIGHGERSKAAVPGRASCACAGETHSPGAPMRLPLVWEDLLVDRLYPTDRDVFLRAVAESGELLAPWVEAPSTAEAFAGHLRRYERPSRLPLIVRRRASGELVGAVNIRKIVPTVDDCGTLSYYAFRRGAGRGLMRSAVGAVITALFAHAVVRRLRADIDPANERSIRLAEALGFEHRHETHTLGSDGVWLPHGVWGLAAAHER